MLRAALIGATFAVVASAARADVIDRIDIAPRNGEAEVRVGFTVPMHYVNHFPKSSGAVIEVFFDSATIDGTGPERPPVAIPETKRSPRSDLVPPFTITWHARPTDANQKATDVERDRIRLVIQFEKAVDFRLEEDRDKRGLVLFVKRVPGDGRAPQ